MLQFLDDNDILNVAATCRAIYRMVYSPLGFRFIRQLRPIVYNKEEERLKALQKMNYMGDENGEGAKGKSFVKIEELITDEEIPSFTQNTIDQLCSDRNLQTADEDDKWAILLTMKTNILATKQKIRELDLIIREYDQKS